MKRKIINLIIIISFTISLSSCESIVIINSSQLLSIINSMQYEDYPYPSSNLPISEDILIIGTVTITSEQLEVPEECANREDCRDQVGFENIYGADGISLSPLSSDHDLYPPSSLTLTNVKLRFRSLIINTGIWEEYNFTPVIQLMAPSDYECDDSQTKCDVDEVCYDDYYSYCPNCLTLSQKECSCRDENGIFNDGTPCIITGGDVIYDGECQDGECIVD